MASIASPVGRMVTGILVACLLVSGCAGQLKKMNRHAPIEKRSAFLGTSYAQGGESLDGADMLEKLEQEPKPADELAGHTALTTTALILSAAGGALIGWPLGQAIAGAEDPMWVLAGVGGGLIAVSIPFSVVAANKVDNAVDAHNERVAAPDESFARRPAIHDASAQKCEVGDGTAPRLLPVSSSL